MEKSFKESMRWLHTYSGLIVGWLLFAIFVTGTTSFYRNEITTWMQPELQYSKESNKSFDIAKKKAIELSKNKDNLSITLPNSRSNTITVRWSEKQKKAKRDKRFVKYFDATTGKELNPRQTAGGNFLYRFHFELYSMPKFVGRWIVGIATMSMLVAIITGIIIHTRIFKDIFTFRNKANPRGWMDAHILPAVAALPFHIMITYSGLVLLMRLLMPWGLNSIYQNDFRAFFSDYAKLKQVEMHMPNKKEKQITIAKQNLDSILNKANKIYPNNIGSFFINNEKETIVEIRPKKVNSIFNLRFDKDSLVFDAKTTKLIEKNNALKSTSIVSNTHASLEALHRARFADSIIRFIFFIAGVSGIVLAATGLILWIEKRKKKYSKKKSYGFYLVDKLNIGTIAGLFMAISAYFIANRIISIDTLNREHIEIKVFFIVWLLSYIHAFITNSKKAWVEQFIVISILYISIPIINILMYKRSILLRDSIYNYFDLFFIFCSFTFAIGSYFLIKKSKKEVSK
ncbi:PepSY domain-containing protein [Arcobacter sp. CECT 8985]|uniref:PepSY-associated TM helix domain-containing protein n=1 Tax=Arcobacter sp. CECT 8985 TaxID=1935424 RepID=UPI00100BAD22|nr:PepSY-associated TM helix domain-containing protein [Arcobacter sp. CECT 8985]RXJ86770.1 hypothetical protein CRU93_06785 [Arcobacter sp. CECT 8985]